MDMSDQKKIVKAITLPPAGRPCQITIPREVSDRLRAEGVTSMVVYTVGDSILIEPIR